MIKKRAYIVILVVFQLLVFVAPHFVKAIHHHAIERAGHHPATEGKSFAKAAKWCPICKFEFVPTISKEDVRFDLFQQVSLIKNAGLVHQISKISFTSCLLRGPPIS